MELYRKYLLIGGMPEAVLKFIETSDFNQVNNVQQSILTTYRADITNYAGKDQVLVKRIYDAIPSQLGKQDKRFVLASIEKGASKRKFEDPTQWLVDSGLAYYSFNTSAMDLPLSSTENRNLYKLYMADVGLLSQLLLKGIQFEVLQGNININEGALTENYVACSLAAKENQLHYYDKKSKHELDFILEDNGKILLLEVKSGNDYDKHASLDYAIEKFPEKISKALVLCKDNIQCVNNNIFYIPLYMTMFL